MPTGNKGEWSEFYVFVKLLADGKIYAADRNMNKIESVFYPVLKIIRGKTEDTEYVRTDDNIVIRKNGQIVSEIPTEELARFSDMLYAGIEKGDRGKRSFEAEFAKPFFEKLHVSSLSDERKETADIRIVIHDPITQREPLLGFSIKSYIGSKPTLFNASKNSNLIYRIHPELDDEQRAKLNALETYGARIAWLHDNGYRFEFAKPASEIFQTNLELVDSRLPEILSHLILCKYSGGPSKISELIDVLNRENPCGFNLRLNPNFYAYKIKRLLTDAALGMKAGKLWTGTFHATGGYIVAKRNGELACFHIHNLNDFQDYLAHQTKIDCPDSNPDRCDYGRILTSGETGKPKEDYIKLNFQIRFV